MAQQPSASALSHLRSNVEILTHELSNSRNPIQFKEIVFNLKGWEPGRDVLMEKWFRHSKSKLIRGTPRIKCALEELGTLEGSGCAMINTLKACNIDSAMDGLSSDHPSLGLLIAGEGSRLWGISAGLGFVKGLSNVLGFSLTEQTVHQSLFLLSEAPHRGKNMIVIAGTDNVFLPSQKLSTVDGTPFAQCKNHLFFFSKEVQVLDEKDQVADKETLDGLTQLGIMLLNDKSEPILFLEKVSTDRILEVLRQHKKRSVFFNTFYFAMTREGGKLLQQLYSRPASNGKPIYELNGFDWSMHVLEALATPSSEAWAKRNNRKFVQSDADWQLLFELGQEFKAKLGAPAVINIGSEAIWYDTGLANDLVHLYELAVSNGPLNAIMRQLFDLPPHRDVVKSFTNGVKVPAKGSYLVVNSLFKNGGSIGKGSVIVNSVFEKRTVIPPNTIVVNSHVYTFVRSSAMGALVYGYADPQTPLQLLPKCAHFSAFAHPVAAKTKEQQQAAEKLPVLTLSGVFPLSVIPKDKGTEPLLNWYNVAERAGKPYLVQQILGFNEPLSFRDLQEGRRVSLRHTLEFAHFLQKLPKEHPTKAKL